MDFFSIRCQQTLYLPTVYIFIIYFTLFCLQCLYQSSIYLEVTFITNVEILSASVTNVEGLYVAFKPEQCLLGSDIYTIFYGTHKHLSEIRYKCFIKIILKLSCTYP